MFTNILLRISVARLCLGRNLFISHLSSTSVSSVFPFIFSASNINQAHQTNVVTSRRNGDRKGQPRRPRSQTDRSSQVSISGRDRRISSRRSCKRPESRGNHLLVWNPIKRLGFAKGNTSRRSHMSARIEPASYSCRPRLQDNPLRLERR